MEYENTLFQEPTKNNIIKLYVTHYHQILIKTSKEVIVGRARL